MEKAQVNVWNGLYDGVTNTVNWSPGCWGSATNDAELAELGLMRTDGDYSHGAGGDGLSVLDEYRGYVFDGGPNDLTNCHKRLSFSRKEILVEVRVQEDMMAGVGTGEIPNPAAVQAFSLPEEMAGVSDFYCHSTRGVGADLYWCVDKLTMPVVPYTYQDGTSVSNVYRHTGRIIYEPKDGITNPVIEEGGTWLRMDYKMRIDNKLLHDTLFCRSWRKEYSNIGCEHLLKNNRNVKLKPFLHIVLPDRLSERINVKSSEIRIRAHYSHHAQSCYDTGHLRGEVDGAHVDPVGISEERVPPFSVMDFKNTTRFSIAHELGHLLGLRHIGAEEQSGQLLAPPINLNSVTASSNELSNILILGKTKDTP